MIIGGDVGGGGASLLQRAKVGVKFVFRVSANTILN